MFRFLYRIKNTVNKSKLEDEPMKLSKKDIEYLERIKEKLIKTSKGSKCTTLEFVNAYNKNKEN